MSDATLEGRIDELIRGPQYALPRRKRTPS